MHNSHDKILLTVYDVKKYYFNCAIFYRFKMFSLNYEIFTVGPLFSKVAEFGKTVRWTENSLNID